MKVSCSDCHISLRPENDEERVLLKEMEDTGIEVWGRGSYMSFSSKKHRDGLIEVTTDDTYEVFSEIEKVLV